MPEVDEQFEKFDIDTFNKENVRGKRTELTEKFYIEEDTQSFGYAKQLFPNRSYFSVLKLYYENGNIKEKGVSFNNGSEIGYWYAFDKSGKMIQRTVTDKGYDFGHTQIVNYCEKNEIPLTKGFENSGFQTTIYKNDDKNGQKAWQITYQTGPEKLMEITLDGKTGKEIGKKELEFVNH